LDFCTINFPIKYKIFTNSSREDFYSEISSRSHKIEKPVDLVKSLYGTEAKFFGSESSLFYQQWVYSFIFE